MNILIYDTPPGIAYFAASVLRRRGFRVAVTKDPEEARLRIDTALFDAVILGPSGAPRSLADFIEQEFPRLPVILAGVPAERPPSGQLAAVLPAPLSAERLISTLRFLERRRRERLAGLPVSLLQEGIALSCRLADLDGNTLMLAGESDELQRHFGGDSRRVRVSVLGLSLEGVAAPDRCVSGPGCRLNVQLDPPGAGELLRRLRKEPLPSS